MSTIGIPLSTEMLEKNYCSYCKKYLSYGPVRVNPSGNISCGRCSPTEGCPGTVSFYEKVAPYLVFPCIYKPQGCSVQLRWDLVKDHEKRCRKKQFYCPLCPLKLGHTDFFLGKLSNHFKNLHDDDILKKPEFTLNINNFDTTERHLFFSKPESMLFMLMFVKFDGQWLYINISVPYGYGVDNFKQVVTNVGIAKFCSHLGDNSNCFKFFLPRILDCIAKIDLNVVEDTIEITILLLPNEAKATNDVPRIKSELDPPYTPEFYWDNELKKVLGEMDFNAHSFSGSNKTIRIRNDKILFGKCNFCQVFIWESFLLNSVYYMCAHYNICHSCYNDGYKKCKFDDAPFTEVFAKPIQIQASCRYGCGSYINYLRYKDHEKMCKLNILRFLSSYELSALCFGSEYQFNSLFVHDNIIKFYFKPGENKSCGIITNENQKCILHYICTNGKQFFEVEHEYDKRKFSAVIQIRCDETVREEQNFFYRNNKYGYIRVCHSKKSEYLLFSIKIVNCNDIFKKLKLG